MERSSGRNYSQAAIEVLVIATSSALTEMWTIWHIHFYSCIPKSSKLFGRALLPLPSAGITGWITGGTVPGSHERCWNPQTPQEYKRIWRTPQLQHLPLGCPQLHTAATEELWFEQQLSPGDVLERGDSNSEKITYIGMHRGQQFNVNVST